MHGVVIKTIIANRLKLTSSHQVMNSFQNFSELSLTTLKITKLVTTKKSSSLSSKLFQLLLYVRLCKESTNDRLQSRRETASAE